MFCNATDSVLIAFFIINLGIYANTLNNQGTVYTRNMKGKKLYTRKVYQKVT